ncbi:1750_t:CDS:2 [Funneliformis mosseae]|uniref:1750_t:CDS:1 n=1 Tax=Funneliformis mosseae TaxID=27381 RepID=A0A9N9GDD7_FUNMO|nr:1750_t:CDS:2 [Funneliformis mosseae]
MPPLALLKELVAENNSLNDEAESSIKVLAKITLQSNGYENNEQEPLEDSNPILIKLRK